MEYNFDINNIRAQFPILNTKIGYNKLVYLDNAATSQKPIIVLDSIQNYYKTLNANVHRGIHTLSQLSTNEMEDSRREIQKFINAKYEHEIIFTKGTTESINLVAASIQDLIQENDEIIISHLEHHANIVPWQMLALRKKAKLKIIPIDENGDLIYEEFEKLISEKTKILALTYISNALGIVNPIEKFIKKAREFDVSILIDAAQAVTHKQIDVQKIDCDFLVFSGHKMYASTGIGILYGKEEILNKMNPYQFGGEMIKEVTFEKTTFQDLPFKFEAGTPHIEACVTLKNAVKFIQSIGYENIQKHENELLEYLTTNLNELENIIIYGKNAKNKAGAVSFNFNINGVSSSDFGFILDKQGIAVRTGHHCAQPIMNFFNVPGTIRASFGIFNTKQEIDLLINALKKAYKMLN